MAGTALLFELIARGNAPAEFTRLAGAADKAAASTARMNKGLAGASAAAGRHGAALTKKLTLPLLAVAAVSVDQAAKYQKSLNVIAVATDQTAKQMQGSSKGLTSIAKSTGTTLSQLTDALYTVEKGGLRGSKALDAVRAAAQGAKAEGADLGTVSNALTSIMASYGSKLSDPVKAMNMIVRGSGLAKTTLQDFAGSLSTVVPVAASLGISFDQVAGAIDTMTQHGETAQHATDNLRNLITNLAGQNNVASQSLQQLGVNTVDLSKNMGKRGLTGTLDIVLAAIQRHGKDGMIVTSAFKQAATATASLRTEIGTMPKVMQTNAKAFDAGQMSYKNFYAYAKSLGGQQFAMAKQFLATESTAKGFNNQLRTGNGTVRTLASTLQKSLGGVTGMNTALQLSGESAGKFHSYVAQIGDAAKHVGGDVLGWAQTQNTLAVKMDKAKASMQVMAVEIGAALLPAVSKIVDGVSKAVHAFDGLSGTQKKILGWSAATLLAIGPIMSIGSRIGSAGAGLARFAGAAETTASRVGLATQRIGAALAGIGLVYAGTQTGGTAGHLMGAAGGAIAGASLGSFIAPGLGTAIGAVAGGVIGLGLSYLHTGDSAKKAADKQKAAAQQARDAVLQQAQAVDTLRAAIDNDSDSIGRNTRLQVVNDLQKSGALALAQKNNISPKLVTDAAMGNQKAKSQLNTQIGAIANKAITSGSLTGTGSVADVAKLNGLLRAEGIVLSKAGNEADLTAEAMGKLNFSTRSVADETARYKTSLDQNTVAGRANVKFIGDHVTALDTQLAKGKLTDKQWVSQIGTLQSQLKQYHFNADGVKNYIAGFAKVPKSVVTRLLADPKIAHSAIGDVLRALGIVPKAKNTRLTATNEAKPTITGLGGMLDRATNPRSVTIDANTTPAMGRLQTLLANIPSGTFHFNVVEDYYAHPGHTPPKKARGDIISGPGTGTSDTAGVFALSNGEAVIPAMGVRKHRGVVDWLIQEGRGLAAGGVVAGIRYSSNLGYRNALARQANAASKHRNTSSTEAVSSAIGGIGQSYSPPFSVADVGIGRLQATIGSAIRTLQTQMGKGLSAATARGFAAQIAGLTKIANAQLSALRVKIKGSDLAAMRAGLKGTVDDTRTALQQLYTDFGLAGGSSGALSRLRAKGSALLSAQSTLSSARDYRSSVSDTLRGAFDPTQYGSAADLVTGLNNASGVNKSYGSEAAKLRKAGLNTGLLNTLLASGQNATLESLAGASKADIAQVNKAYGGYNASVASGSGSAELAKFGKSVDQLAEAQTEIAAAVSELASAVGSSMLTAKTDARIQEALRKITAAGRHGRK